ncbi:hypothetical protein [Hymenobacter sp. DG01]|uniref:hypothetical protein n=1 Tax=Hymenobacter sp. DG01 TaxID=2584940 RepID=UPI0011220F5A|nr:hypothetical protein [Hymenobacter sp. DG01]
MVTTASLSVPNACPAAEQHATPGKVYAKEAAATPHFVSGKREHPGEFLGSVVGMDEVKEGYEIETFIYVTAGRAQAHTYSAALYSPLSTYSCTTTWNVASKEQVREWVKLEQLAAGLRQAYRRQLQAAREQGRENVPALQRLLAATQLASDRADAHPSAPLLGVPRNHGLLAQ